MKKIIAAVILSLLFGSATSQQLDSTGRIAIDQRKYVAEPQHGSQGVAAWISQFT